MDEQEETMYAVTLGSGHTTGISYAVSGWERLTLQQMGDVLSTVTGYTSAGVIEQIEKRMDRLGYSTVYPADCGGANSPVRFLIRRDGG